MTKEPHMYQVPFRSGFLSTFVLFSLLTTSFIRFSTLTVRTWNTKPKTNNHLWENLSCENSRMQMQLRKHTRSYMYIYIYIPTVEGNSQIYCCGNQLDQHPWMEFSLGFAKEYKQRQCCSPYFLPGTTYHHGIMGKYIYFYNTCSRYYIAIYPNVGSDLSSEMCSYYKNKLITSCCLF